MMLKHLKKNDEKGILKQVFFLKDILISFDKNDLKIYSKWISIHNKKKATYLYIFLATKFLANIYSPMQRVITQKANR